MSASCVPWFGVDIGGTLMKVVYFEPADNQAETETLKTIRQYLTSNTVYGERGIRDVHLTIKHVEIYGRTGNLHFMRLPIRDIPTFLQSVKSNNFSHVVDTVWATGGGAYIYADDAKNIVNVTLEHCPEVESLISGIDFIDSITPNECYYWSNSDSVKNETCEKVPYDFKDPYPYLLVSMGSGFVVSCVTAKDTRRPVAGTSLGGRTFLGLCCLLTGCQTFDEAIELAETGDHTKVDQLAYDGLQLNHSVPAYSFGHMVDPEKRQTVSKNNLAKATLVTLTNNIAYMAVRCAKHEGIKRIVYVGNFLRENTLAVKLLSNTTRNWTNGTVKALFFEHEGYFCATGALLEFLQKKDKK